MIPIGYGTSTLITADAQVTAVTKATRLYSMHVLSGAGGGAVITMKSGGSGGTTYLVETGTASKGATFNYGEAGITFPAGLYVDVDTNTTSVVLTYAVGLA